MVDPPCGAAVPFGGEALDPDCGVELDAAAFELAGLPPCGTTLVAFCGAELDPACGVLPEAAALELAGVPPCGAALVDVCGAAFGAVRGALLDAAASEFAGLLGAAAFEFAGALGAAVVVILSRFKAQKPTRINTMRAVMPPSQTFLFESFGTNVSSLER